MKKIFTLLLAAGLVTVASAQSKGFDHGKQVHEYAQKNDYSFNAKQSPIQDINRMYDFKISAIRQNRRMNRFEKAKQIGELERQRDADIARISFRSEKDKRSFNDHEYTDNKKHSW